MLKLFQVLFFLFFLSQVLISQNQANIWYFGINSGLDFNGGGAPVVLTDGAFSTLEGSSSICDDTGSLLFYTDGITVYDKTHTQMPNGFGLMGHTSTSQVLISKQPLSDSLYYIFTISDQASADGLRYSIVDMSLNGGLGDVFTKNVLLYTPSTEKVTSVPHCNTIDTWIITHDYGSNAFRVFLLTKNGLNTTPIISNVGLSHSGFTGNALGCMKASPDGTRLAVAIESLNRYELFDFNRFSGIVSNPLTFPANYDWAYGVEFSPDGTKLYTTNLGRVDPSRIYQFDLQAGSAAAIFASETILKSNNGIQFTSLQRGPDNKIYVSRYKTGYLGRINIPNALGTACNYTNNAIFLNGKECQFGLPFCSQNILDTIITVDMSSTNATCNGWSDGVATIDITDGNPPYTYSWNPGGASTASVSGLSAGTYSVVFTNQRGCPDTSLVTITQPPPLIVTAGSLATICEGDSVNLTAQGAITYSWSPANGLSASTGTPVIAYPTNTISYLVVGADSAGCLDSAVVGINVDSKPVAQLGNDTSICQGQSLTLLATGGSNYLWNTGELSAFITVSPITTSVYSVTVTSGVCLPVSDEMNVVVYSGPVVTVSNDTSIIAGNSVKLSASGGGSYSWSPTDGLDCVNCSDPLASPVETTTYNVLVTDSNACTTVSSVTIVVDITCGDIFVPNVFSPNKDLQNDMLYIKARCISQFEFIIYSRWGEVVFMTSDPEIGWDGTFRGKPMDTGVFSYFIKALGENGKDIDRKGTIALLR